MPKNVPKTDYVVQSNEGFLRGLIAGHAIKDATHVLTHIGGYASGDFTPRDGEQAHQGRVWAFNVLSKPEETK